MELLSCEYIYLERVANVIKSGKDKYDTKTENTLEEVVITR